jgi:hypothetical protein
MWGLRIVRTVPTLAALAHADTLAPMMSNVARSAGLCGSICAAAAGMSLTWVAISGLAGELLALPVLMWRLKNRHSVSERACLVPLTLIVLATSVAGLLAYFDIFSANTFSVLFGTVLTAVSTVVILLAIHPPLRDDLRSFASSALGSLGIKTTQRAIDA